MNSTNTVNSIQRRSSCKITRNAPPIPSCGVSNDKCGSAQSPFFYSAFGFCLSIMTSKLTCLVLSTVHCQCCKWFSVWMPTSQISPACESPAPQRAYTPAGRPESVINADTRLTGDWCSAASVQDLSSMIQPTGSRQDIRRRSSWGCESPWYSNIPDCQDNTRLVCTQPCYIHSWRSSRVSIIDLRSGLAYHWFELIWYQTHMPAWTQFFTLSTLHIGTIHRQQSPVIFWLW